MSDNNARQYLQQLAQKILAGKATEEEKLFLEEYYNAFDQEEDPAGHLSEGELQYINSFIKHKLALQLFNDKEQAPVYKPLYRYLKRWAAAAVLLGCIGLAYYFIATPTENPVSPAANKQPAEILPGSDRAVLTLQDGTQVALDNASKGVIARQDQLTIQKPESGKLVYSRASPETSSPNKGFNIIETPRGGQYQVILPDGTKAWLNAASSLKFPTQFDVHTRAVEMTGEVYFEVAHRKAQPFIVKAGSTRVEVLGTHFNVMAYPEEKFLKTTLLEGAVRVQDANRMETLAPGEQISISDIQFRRLKNIDTATELAWKNGFFHFQGASVAAVMRQVARWYDIDVRYEGKIPEKQFTGIVPRNVGLSELMEMLSFYDDLKCRIEGKSLTISQ